MVLSSIVFAAIVNVAAADEPTDREWESFKNRFGKAYNGESEEDKRKGIFAANFAHILEHNKGESKYTLSVNQFADLTETEWRDTYTNTSPLENADVVLGTHGERPEAELADSVDWTTAGAVTPIKDQKECGSCWSFSTTGALEGANQIASGQLVSLSQQHLMDCDTETNNGCHGGQAYKAFEYVRSSGLCTDESYPYLAKDHNTCQPSSCTLGLQPGAVSGYVRVEKTENALMSAVMQQPVSIEVYVAAPFQWYSGGIYTADCHQIAHHAVLVTGYGTLDGTPYWRVKNSWGSWWGDAGYINLERGFKSFRNRGNACMLEGKPTYPVMTSAVAV